MFYTDILNTFFMGGGRVEILQRQQHFLLDTFIDYLQLNIFCTSKR